MSDGPWLSVIVPVHGPLDHLPEALRSLARQLDPGCEVFVVDDGCTEPPDELVRAILPQARLRRQANAGPSAARNRGLREATGTFVAFLDGDDRWTADALVQFTRGFRDAPGAEIVQGHVRRFATDPTTGRERVLGQPYLGFNVGALMARRTVLLDAGLFDEALRQSEDVDLFMRLHARGVRRLMLPATVLDYRRHPGSLTATTPFRGLAHGAAENWLRLLHGHMGRRRGQGAPPAPPPAPPPVPVAAAISVVMVVKDGRRHLPAALASLRRQTLPPSEVVAIVGRSTDGTLEFLAAQPDVRVVEQTGSGLARARNQGLAEARGELVAFLDHDDLWQPRKLARQVEVLALFARPGACVTGLVELADGAPAAGDERLARLGWTPSALLAHRAVFERLGGFDPALGIGCDTDWFRRLRAADIPCGVTAQPLLQKRRHGGNLSRSSARNRAAMFEVIRKHRLERDPS